MYLLNEGLAIKQRGKLFDNVKKMFGTGLSQRLERFVFLATEMR